MNQRDGNIVFKCTYNAGDFEKFVGFNGTCSDANIIRNIRSKRNWCSNQRNRCYQFYKKSLQGPRPVHPCYESQIFQTWRFGAGVYQTGNRAGQPIPLKEAKRGKVALLTTRHPKKDTEAQRIVFAVFKIKKVEDYKGQTWARGNAKQAIRIPEEVAFSLPYWKFKSGNPDWRTGLFRYISDQEVINYLHALRLKLKSPKDRGVIEELMNSCGTLPPTKIDTRNILTKSDLLLKYGPGGEGQPHLRLKNFIARNPKVLGLGRARKVSVEHSFMTGDRVDIWIEFATGDHCVVEIEVEGEHSTMIGAHQALKYRALLAGHLNATKMPRAFLIAYSIPKSTKDFCRRHKIRALELRPT